MKYLFKKIRIIDPSVSLDKKADLLIEKGNIKKIGQSIPDSASKIIDGTDLVVMPGLFDMHVHLREPGREDEETIESGSKAAVKGGFTNLACLPNTFPTLDKESVLNDVIRKSKDIGLVNIYPIAAITKGLKGRELTEMAELKRAGACGFSDDGKYLEDALVMRMALEYSKMIDTTLILHEEEKTLARGGQLHEGKTSTILGMKGIPSASENIAINRDINLLESFGGKIHIAHLSTTEAVEMVGRAKSKGLNITCEVTPHHLLFSDEDLMTFDTNLKVKPPIRTAEDRKALRAGLKEGIIDVIATDHAPHAMHEKESEFNLASFGLIGLETAFSVIYTRLVKKGLLTINQLIEKMSINPSRILGLAERKIKEGLKADIVVVDLGKEKIININDFESKSKNCPYDGWSLWGSIEYVFKEGNCVMEDGKLKI